MVILIVELVMLSILLTMCERSRPFVRRSDKINSDRQLNHFLLLAINQGVGLLLAFIMSRMLVVTTEMQEWSPLHLIGLSGIPLIIVGIIFLDLGGYVRHRIMHLPWLWPAHKLHHSDVSLDWTSELRFHPLEVLVEIGVRFVVITTLAIPLDSIALFAVLALPIGLFQHANVELPKFAERVLGTIIVTPALHRVHHSINPQCYGRNFAVLFIGWDKLFCSYRTSEREKAFGLTNMNSFREMGLKDMLLIPFQKGPISTDAPESNC